MSVQDAIRAARGQRSRQEFAMAVGASEVAVWKWETGKSLPSLPKIGALLDEGVDPEVFGLTVQRLAAASA